VTAEEDRITLREYIDMRMDASDKAVSAALASADRAVSKAESATEKRFESVNEFRAALADSGRLLMPRSEAEQSFRVLSDKTDALTRRLDAKDSQGKGKNDLWIIVASIISAISTISLVIFTLLRTHS
jgi:uncharacterized Rmd1/YagE family protein